MLYILVIHRHTVSLYHNTSMWLDTRDAWSWDRNLADLMPVGYPIAYHQQTQQKRRDFNAYVCFVYMYTLIGYRNLFQQVPLYKDTSFWLPSYNGEKNILYFFNGLLLVKKKRRGQNEMGKKLVKNGCLVSCILMHYFFFFFFFFFFFLHVSQKPLQLKPCQ